MEQKTPCRLLLQLAQSVASAKLESLRDTVASLEARRDSLTASRRQSLQPTKRETLAREHALLLTQAGALQQEGERLRLLLRHAAGFGPPSILDDTASELESDGEADPVTDIAHTTPLPRRSKRERLQCGVSPLTQNQKEEEEQSLEMLRCRVESTPGHAIPSSSDSATRDQIPYKPLTVAASKVLVSEAYRSILSFSSSEALRASTSHVLGWENTRSPEATTPSFSLRKTFPALDAEEAVGLTWEDLLHATRASQTFSGLLQLRVLQRVSDDVAVALREPPSNVDGVTASRCVLLVFRMRTASGFLVGLRSMTPANQAHSSSSSSSNRCNRSKGNDVGEEAKDEGEDDPESPTESASGRWGFHFSWFSFDRVHCSDELEKAEAGGAVQRRGTRVTYSGCGDESEHEAMATLATNALSMMLRWEAATLAPPFALPST